MYQKKCPYHPKKILCELVHKIRKMPDSTPTKLAREMNLSKVTVKKNVEALEALDIISCKSIEMGKRKIKICSIKENFKEEK